ncbi:MAG: hypothetical protein NW206_18785 [Hyphomonadaceae bacterium]|nr:hypothetical protein [Hyphomonadaceae bacterium]
MRMTLALAALIACMSAPAPSFAQVADGWSYAYVDGVATATRRDSDGDVTATITCRPPDGVMVLSAEFGRDARGTRTAQLRIGQGLALNLPAETEGRGGRARVVIDLPQRPPVLAGVQPSDEIAVTVGGVTKALGVGSGRQMEDVAYACWSAGN